MVTRFFSTSDCFDNVVHWVHVETFVSFFASYLVGWPEACYEMCPTYFYMVSTEWWIQWSTRKISPNVKYTLHIWMIADDVSISFQEKQWEKWCIANRKLAMWDEEKT